MQRNQVRLEGIPKKLYCVQCDQEFREHTNGPTACSFHRAEKTGSGGCAFCSTAHPCQSGFHRADFHRDYPYGAFYQRCREVLQDPTTREEWTSVEDTHLETKAIQKASISELCRWPYRPGRLEKKTLLITVGHIIADNSPFYFNMFTAEKLEEITKSVRLSRRVLIFRTSNSEDEYAQAEWVPSASGEITGVRLTAKTTTSLNPYVRICPINPATCTKSGDIVTVSEGGFYSYTPSGTYTLPQTIRFGPIVSSEQTRPVRKNFTTRTTPALKVVLKTISEPPLSANTTKKHQLYDYFRGTVSVFNQNSVGSLTPVTISGIRAEYRLVGEQNYMPAEQCTFTDGSASLLPYTIEPRKSWQINFEVSLPRTEADARLRIAKDNCATMARFQPVRVKLIVEEIGGEECSLVLEYVFKPEWPFYDMASENSLAFFSLHDPVTLNRIAVNIEPGIFKNLTNVVVRMAGRRVTEFQLNQAVYYAMNSGKTEIQLRNGLDYGDRTWQMSVYALIDVSCRRVYAFKIILQDGWDVPVKRLGLQGYVLCPDYGKFMNEMRPISYATEVAKLPPMEPYRLLEYPQDDTMDDFDGPAHSQDDTDHEDDFDEPTHAQDGTVHMGNFDPPAQPLDDTVDGFDPPAQPHTLPSLSTDGIGGGPSELTAELTSMGTSLASIDTRMASIDTRMASIDTRMASVDTNLARIADALEKLVGIGRIS